MHVLIYTHGGPSIGAGHAIRSVALAEQAQTVGHDVTLVGEFTGDFLNRQLRSAAFDVVRVPDGADHPPSRLVAGFGADVLHVDRYDAAADELVARSRSASFLVSNVEDGPYGRRSADLTLDPTLRSEHDHRAPTGGVVRRGARFAPLRRDVVRRRGLVELRPEVARVLVLMGGTDAAGFTPAVLDVLARTRVPVQVTAVTTDPTLTPARPAGLLDLTRMPPAEDVAALMVSHDLVVSAAGTSMAELFCLGVPTVLVCVADNQRSGYQRALDAGAAVGIDPADADRTVDVLRRVAEDCALRRTLSGTASRLVDGLGAWRVVRTWEQLTRRTEAPAVEPTKVNLRPATSEDADLLLEWRNDLATRNGSRQADAVDPATHRGWLAESLSRPDRILLVGADAEGPVGTVRWDGVTPEEWEVSITVAPHRRGEGLALPLLRAGERELYRRMPTATTLLASVRTDNDASQRLFESAGYTPDLPADAHGFLRLLTQRLH